ncbi:MAG TPA: hypothetical protein PK544_09910 [Spirochaetota bacterium]|nr:hypothetical protein [Spirochaetota bacterium]HPJ37618.1 hypothetical protein [Spirochaetota bacterium]HPQ52932.1 hypothetical protein [Spirochaetota bacterium]
MIDYDFIEIQKQRIIEYIEGHFSRNVPEKLEHEISRVLHQIAMNENKAVTEKPGKTRKKNP